MKTLYIILLFLFSYSLSYSQENWDTYWIDKDWYFIQADSIIQKRMKTAFEPFKGMNGCNQIEFKDSLNGLLFCWAGGRNSWVFKTTNGGSFWKETFFDDIERNSDSTLIRPPGYLRNAAVNGNQVIIPVQYNNNEKFDPTGYILRSIDFGSTFEKIVPDTGLGFFDISMLNGKYGALLRYYSVLTTNDSGKTWIESKPKPDSLKSFQFIQVVDVNKIFVYRTWWQKPGSNENRIFYSSDNGNSWETIIPPGFDIYKAYFFNENEGLIIGCGDKNDKSTHDTLFVKYTYDRGKTWINTWDTVLSGQVRIYNQSIYDLKFYNRNNGIFVGDYGVIFQTIDGGRNWSFIGVKDDAPKGKSHFIFKRIEFINENKIITTGSVFNSELLVIPLKTPVSVKENLPELNIDFFPNPVTDKIIFKQPVTANKIEILDLLGNVREILTNVYNLDEINLSMLENGTYFVNIYSNEGFSSNKIIKL
jgi:photosystem II stability/assembly factor-like uncharacterized protein